MNKKIFVLLFFLIVLISVSAVSAVDLDDNNETVVASEIVEEQLSLSNDVNAIDDLNDDADSDVVLENAVNSSVVGEKEILGAGYAAEGDSDSDVLSANQVLFYFSVYEWGEYTTNPAYPRISGYGYGPDGEDINQGTLSIYLNNKLYTTVSPEEAWFDANLGPLSPGTYTIRAVYHDDSGYYDDYTYNGDPIDIVKASTSIMIQQDSVELEVGDEISTSATLFPSDAGTLNYSSSDAGVAEVVNNKIVAKKSGSATIIVSFGGNENYTAATSKTIAVTVKEDKTPTSINITNSTVNLKANEEIAAGATLTPADAGNLTYTSSNSSVAVVQNGKIKALVAGSAIITVSFAGNDEYAAAENKTIAVTVSLNDAGVSVKNATLDLLIDDEFVLVVTTVPEGLDVTFTPDNSGVVSVDEDGVVTALKEGTATVKVSVGGDGVYALNTTDVSVTVSKIPTEITVGGDVDMKVGDNDKINATLSPADAGELDYTSSDVSIVEVNGIGELTAVGDGTAVITIRFVGNDKYAAAESKNVTVNVTKIDTSISVDADSIKMSIGGNAKINATLSPADAGELDYTSRDVSIVEVNGIGELTAVGDGTAVITIRFVGDDKYAAAESKNVTVTVGKLASKFAEISVVKNNVTLLLSDEDGNPISDANISYAVNGVSNATVSDANGSFVIIGEPGAEIVVNYAGSDVYLPSNITIKMLPERQSTVIVGGDFTQYACDYYVGERGKNFTVQLTDADGNPLANKTVFIGYNGVTLNRTTDANGFANVQINLKNAGLYTFVVVFLDDDNYNATMKVFKITIKKKTTSIAASAKTFKASAKTKKYTVTLKTIKGASIDGKTYLKKGKKVTLTVNGKTYTAKTNAKGQATFSLKITKKGKFTAVIKYAGDNTYKSASKKAKITIK